ncbi:hypothetical protein Syun_019499 [Stephania yunnanensis]|uniref:COBRA C-terminal domain-containing protein n=1 Tax=Stephania yunnanensis TaxID=152371 RepID=A0AAP0NVZ0_9MAGN
MMMNPPLILFMFFLLSTTPHVTLSQDYVFETDKPKPDPTTAAAEPPESDTCNGIFLSYNFISRAKELPHLKNATAQSWAFKSVATVLNAGSEELKAWKMFIGFHHDEILVSASGAVVMDGSDFPVTVGGNGTYLSGYPQTDLKTAIETAGDFTQIEAEVEITGTQFGIRPPGFPMPKTIKLVNDGYKCPAPVTKGRSMHVCCIRDKKAKHNLTTSKFLPRQEGDLSLTYDIIQTYQSNYLAQVTIENKNPLGRLDHWNLTWEWMRGEFIYSMRGAYTHRKDVSGCLYGPASVYYKDLDFAPVMNCDKKPIISDLPQDREKDEKIGNLPYCCRNGSLLPTTMDPMKSKSVFQVTVYKIPPDMNRTALSPPQKWKINGVLNPDYKCGPPIRVAPTEFPDPSGLMVTTPAIASWQVVCNITRPKKAASRCCVSFSAFYADSVIPCNTCACGCEDTDTCNPNAGPLLLPSEALLVPFANRTAKAKAWARIKHFPYPKKLPCPDNCGVSINWHLNSDYKSGWTARMTLFNWEDYPFEDWFVAIRMDKASPGFENVFSFNGTRLSDNKTIFFQGLPGLTYLMGETNGTNPNRDPRVPGKQQSVISFVKRRILGLDIAHGDGFPSRLYFNGEECSLPTKLPSSYGRRFNTNLLSIVLVTIATFVLMMDHLS